MNTIHDALGPSGAAPLVPSRYRVADRRDESADAVTLTLEPVDAPVAVGRPGQFHMLWVFGVGEVPISLAGHDHDGRVEHTVKAVGAVTSALCDAPMGSMIGVRGPFGTGFDLDVPDGRDLLVIAGGIGLAPLRPVIHESERQRARFGRVTVLVGARSPVGLLFTDEYVRWRAAGIEVSTIVDTASSGWTGETGVVTNLIPRAIDDAIRTVAVMCGPEMMMRSSASELIQRGVPVGAIQVSLERNMQCAVGMCGRCQLGSHFVCHDGPVFPWPSIVDVIGVRER